MVPSPFCPSAAVPSDGPSRRSEPLPAAGRRMPGSVGRPTLSPQTQLAFGPGPGPFAALSSGLVFTAALAATAALFSAQAPPLVIEVPDSGQIVRVGDFRPRQALGDLGFPGGVDAQPPQRDQGLRPPRRQGPARLPEQVEGARRCGWSPPTSAAARAARPRRGSRPRRSPARNWQTERGLKIGDSLDRVRELYPELISFREWLGGNDKSFRYRWALVLRAVGDQRPARRRAPLRGDPRTARSSRSPCRRYGAGD